MKTKAQIRSKRTTHASTRSFFRYAITTLATLALAASVVACSQNAHDDDENQPPSIAELPDLHMGLPGSVVVPVRATDPDGHAVTLSLSSAPAGATLDGTTLRWTPTAMDVGEHAFVVSATDAGDPPLTAHATFRVSVLPQVVPQNHAPVLPSPPPQVVDAGQPLAVFLEPSDPDRDGVTLSLVTSPETAVLDQMTFRWTPTLADVGSHAVVVAVTDNGAPPLTTHASFTVEVLDPTAPNVNHPPEFWSIPAPGQTAACTAFTASFEALDPDGDALTYTAPNLPAGATLTESAGVATLQWLPTHNQVGLHTLVIQASDDGDPAATATLVYTVNVAPAPPLTLDPVSETLVVGGNGISVTPNFAAHACGATLSATGLPTGASFDPATGTVTWATTPEDFGIYDVTFTLTDDASALNQVTTVARVLVQFQDDFANYTGYSEREVYWPGYGGPVTYAAESDTNATDGQVLHSASAHSHDVRGYAYRVFSRSAVPIAQVIYDVSARDEVTGYNCGSGGRLQLLDHAVVDAAQTWPDWYGGPTPVVVQDVPDGPTFAQLSGSATLSAPSTAVTLVLEHTDASNICTIHVYWDAVLLTPAAAAQP